MKAAPRRIAVILLGGVHQMLHIAPVAAELARRPAISVTIFVPPENLSHAERLIGDLGASDVEIRKMQLAIPLEQFVRSRVGRRLEKGLRLLSSARSLHGYDAILTAERTSTLLKHLPGRMPPFIHIPHGAGDRAKGFEPRIRHFDHVIVAGEKDRRRMLAEGLVNEASCTVSGAIKIDALSKLAKQRPAPLFDNALPIILYNPHFDRNLASWPSLGLDLIDRIQKDGRWNLVVAPHIRTLSRMKPEERSRWLALEDTSRLCIDFGSAALSDMTYTRAADIYVGDVSSQVYEFIVRPRPCVFLNRHGADWRDNPDYLMWHFGAVCDDLDGALAEIARAAERHEEFAKTQRDHALDALGPLDGEAPTRAAEQLLTALERLRRQGL